MLDLRVVDTLLSSDRRIVVTGSGGWLGLVTLDSLAAALGQAFSSRVVALGSAARTLQLRDGTHVQQQTLAELPFLDPVPSWLLHFAFLTKDRAETMDEAAYRAANAKIRDTVLAAMEPIGVEAVFVASSGAAYKAHDPSASPAMRLYGEIKAQDEDAFASWADRVSRRAVIGRIFNVTGPYINKHQAYALASFILAGLQGKPIQVRAPRRVMRGYVAIDELISLAVAEMAAGGHGVARFDTGGEPLELGEVAQAVASQFTGVEVMRAPITEADADVYLGDDKAYGLALSRHGLAPLPLGQQVAKTIDYLRGGQ